MEHSQVNISAFVGVRIFVDRQTYQLMRRNVLVQITLEVPHLLIIFLLVLDVGKDVGDGRGHVSVRVE